ncbi:oxidoreductase [Halobacteriales archaeon QS_8_69_26]|nr:MAG: oxidoreductase [Halobacteriales archaeon QS_8_69_26]
MSDSETVTEGPAYGGRSGVAVRDTAIVTGCSSGIGRATARALRDDGWRVYATARDPADVADLEGCETAALDVTDFGQVEDVVNRVVDETGQIDLLVNNAGFAQLGPIEDVPTARVLRQFDVNVFGPHRLLRAVLPTMREQGEGRIVTVSSAAGLVSFPGGGVYSGAEHAKEAMTDALRAEVEDMGIDVVLVEPGPVQTDFADRAERERRALDRTEAYGDFYRFYDDTQTFGGVPLAVPPEEVAQAVLEAATCADPPSRIPVGRLANFASLARHLPARVRDAAFTLLRWLTS